MKREKCFLMLMTSTVKIWGVRKGGIEAKAQRSCRRLFARVLAKGEERNPCQEVGDLNFYKRDKFMKRDRVQCCSERVHCVGGRGRANTGKFTQPVWLRYYH